MVAKSIQVLVIDDDPSMATIVQTLTGATATSVVSAKTLKSGLEAASQKRFDLVVLDHWLPDGAGLDHIQALIEQDRLRPILYITAQAGSLPAIEAIKRGAYDYLPKPVDFELLKHRIAEAVEYRQLTRLPVLVEAGTGDQSLRDVLVGRCRAMQEVYKAIGRLANLSSPVLIEGEVGTGKEMIARAIHQHGARSVAPFVRVCASDFRETQLEFELFREQDESGDESVWSLERLKGGTLMIDEISSLSSSLQTRLLRYVRDRSSTVRIIFATSMQSRDLVGKGLLRGDLYYDLSPFLVRVPALRDRLEDFELLVAHFMQSLSHVSAASDQDGPPRVSPAAMNMLKSYDWPGNIAQLKSVLQSLLLESRGVVLATDGLRRALGLFDRGRPTTEVQGHDGHEEIADGWNISKYVQSEIENGREGIYDSALNILERELIRCVLKHTQGNQAQAARLLGITRTSLRRKIAATQLRVSDFDSSSDDSTAVESPREL